MKFAIKVIHFSYDCSEHNRAPMSPIYQSNMFVLYEIGERVPCRYSHLGNPTRQVLKDTITDLERGVTGFTFSSGMADIGIVWRTFLRPGDIIVAAAGIHGGVYNLSVDVYREWGVNVVFADLGDPDHLDELLAAHNMKLTWLGTPPNPLLRPVDIRALAVKARAVGALVDIDNTFATPYLRQPLETGCDVAFHSVTKYLCGHSDVLMGIIAVKTKELAKPLHNMMVYIGMIAGPTDRWLVSHGIKTLILHMETHCKNALDTAHHLEAHLIIEEVFYPSLPLCEHYGLAKTQMPRDIDDMVTVYPKNNTCEAADSVTKNMRLVKMAFGLGGVESLVNHCHSRLYSGVLYDMKMEMDIKVGLLRLSIGIEEADDIWDDTSKASDLTL